MLSRGVYRPIEFPGAAVTAPLGQNDSGDIVGNYLDQAGASHGFLHTRNGTYTTIDNPNADDNGLVLESFGTIITNINNRGEMVGSYTAGGKLLGFVRDRKGRFTTIETTRRRRHLGHGHQRPGPHRRRLERGRRRRAVRR